LLSHLKILPNIGIEDKTGISLCDVVKSLLFNPVINKLLPLSIFK